MAKRSWWGWGYEHAAVTGAERDRLLERVAALLPGHDLTDHPPPDPRTLPLPKPRISKPPFSDDPEDRAAHSHGKAFRDVARNLQGDLRNVPDLVARPRTEQEVVDLLDWCTREGVAVIPYGGGSSVVGGIEPRTAADYPGVVSLDLEELNQVLEVDPTSRAARIQAGTFGPSLEEQLKKHDLTLRHYPQSFEFSTLGGWLATRAGGHFATLATHIDDLVESIRTVTPVGISESLRVPASGAGPSPDRLFLGSEGTLGVITEAWMRLQARPTWRASASVAFDDYAAAVTATRLVAQSGLHPANCRLLDAAEAFLNAGVSVNGGLLLLAWESADHPVDAALERGLEICRDHGGRPEERKDAAGSWREAFLRMPYQRDALVRSSLIVETFETACTWSAFGDLHAAVTTAAYEAITRVAGRGIVTCRFTHVYPDGPAPYFGIYATGRWGSLVQQWDELKVAVSDALATHGGTITHHHAVGRDHQPWYAKQRPEPFALALRAAKQALDPAGILNPGVF